MTREIDRCRWALDTVRAGRDVALVCSGDAGVYGMASPLLELAEEYPDVNVEIVPGLTAALSGGAVLGAPLAHDSASSRCRTVSRRGRSSKSGWPAQRREISVLHSISFLQGQAGLPAKGSAHPARKRQGG